MLRLNLPVGFLLLPGLLQGRQLALGQDKALLAQFVGCSQLSVGWELHRYAHRGLLHRFRNSILDHRLLAGDLIEGGLAPLLVEFLVPVEGVPAVTHDLAGLGHIAKLPSQFQQAQFGLQHFFLLRSHLTLPSLSWGHLITIFTQCQIKS